MACCMVGNNVLSEPMLKCFYLDSKEQTSMKFYVRSKSRPLGVKHNAWRDRYNGDIRSSASGYDFVLISIRWIHFDLLAPAGVLIRLYQRHWVPNCKRQANIFICCCVKKWTLELVYVHTRNIWFRECGDIYFVILCREKCKRQRLYSLNSSRNYDLFCAISNENYIIQYILIQFCLVSS